MSKKATVSAIDAGGGNGTSGSVGEWTSLCSILEGSSRMEAGWGTVALVGVWVEDITEVVGDCGTSVDFAALARLAFVGRLLLGLRFGSSRSLIFPGMCQFGLRATFA